MEKNNNTNFTHWFFDLDNTLYCANSGIFDQIHKKMGEFISNNLKISLKEAKIAAKKNPINIAAAATAMVIRVAKKSSSPQPVSP